MNRHNVNLIFCCVSLLLFFSCTKSPLGEDIEYLTLTRLPGKVSLTDGTKPDGVYIWLEGTDIHTFTDDVGKFQIELPRSTSATVKLEDGVFNLHYYIANFQIANSTVVVKDGEFVRARGDVNSNGELSGTKPLVRILNIRTEVSPEMVDKNYEGVVNVSVSLQALNDSVVVVLPKLFSVESNAVIFKMTNIDSAFVLDSNGYQPVFAAEKIGPEERIFMYDFYLKAGYLSEGEYQIVPFLLIEQDKMPPGLLESLGPHVTEIGTDFLIIPFKREGGKFIVKPNE